MKNKQAKKKQVDTTQNILTDKSSNLSLKVIFKANIPFFIIMGIFSFILYGHTLWGKFLTADDIPGIVNNPLVQDFAGSWRTMDLERVYPATLIKLWGMNPFPFHLFSILGHWFNVCLVFLFIYLLYGKRAATITSVLFLVHPINSEAVSWISAYGYLVFSLINLLMLTFFLLHRKSGKKNFLYYSLIVFAIGLVLYRKPWILLSPVILVIFDQLLILPKIDFKRIFNYTWYVILSVLYIALWLSKILFKRAVELKTLYYMDTTAGTPYLNRILYTTFMTLKLYFWPQGLTIYHEGEVVGSVGLFTFITAIATIALIGTTIYLWMNRHKQEYRVAAVSVMIIYAAILFSYSPQVLVWSMAERYLYFGTTFFCLTLAVFYIKYATKYPALYYVLLALVIAYTGKTAWRTDAWMDNKRLWTETQKISQYSYRVYNNLGDVYATEENYPLALKYFQMSLQLNPKFADAVHNLGYTYYQMGDMKLAMEYFQKALDMNPLLYQAAYKMGVIQYNQHNFVAARGYFQKTLEIAPDYKNAQDAIKIVDTLIANGTK